MKPFSPTKSMHSSSTRKSPRKGTKYVMTKPNFPFGPSTSLGSSFEYDLGRSTFSILKPEEVNRQEVTELKDRTNTDLHHLFEQEQRGSLPPMQRYVEQLKVLEGSMRDLGGMVRKHCNEQADLLDTIWSSAADLFSIVCKTLSDKVTDLEYQLEEERVTCRKWKEKAQVFKERFQEAAEAGNLTSKAVVDPAHVRDLEEEILIKDKELLRLQKTAANLSIWFPRFSRFSDSVLGRFLPPVEDIEDEDEEANEEEDDPQSQLVSKLSNMGKAKSKLRKNGTQNIDPQLLEAMNLIRSKHLAQDNLLRDLKRLEQLGIGLHVHIGSPEELALLQRTTSADPANISPTQSMIVGDKNQQVNSLPVNTRGSFMGSQDDNASLSLGLFNSPTIASSFSATNGLEYMMKNINKPNSKGSYSQKPGSILNDDKIQEAANNVASLYQSSVQESNTAHGGGRKRGGGKKTKRYTELIVAPPPTVHSPIKTPVLSTQEFYRLQGRKFSQIAQIDDRFYQQDQYKAAFAKGSSAVDSEERKEVNSSRVSDQPGHLLIDTNLFDSSRSIMAGVSEGVVREHDEDDYEDEDNNEDYFVLEGRFQQALKEIQALEIMYNKEVQHREEESEEYKSLIKELRATQLSLRRQLGKANESTTQMIKSLPPIFYSSPSLPAVHNKLQGGVMIKSGTYYEEALLSSESHAVDTFRQQVDHFFSTFTMTKSLSELQDYFDNDKKCDEFGQYYSDVLLDSALNGQNTTTFTFPLLGIQFVLPEFREKRYVYSLLSTLLIEDVHLKVHNEHRPNAICEKVKTMMKHLILILLEHCKVYTEVIQMLPSLYGKEDAEVNTEAFNNVMAYLSPQNAMLWVLFHLFGLDQLQCFKRNKDESVEQWSAMKSIGTIQGFPRSIKDSLLSMTETSNTLNSMESKVNDSMEINSTLNYYHTTMGSITEGDENDEKFSVFESNYPLVSNNQPTQEKTLIPRILDDWNEDDDEMLGSKSSYQVPLNAMKSIEAFDLYAHIYRALQTEITIKSLQTIDQLVSVSKVDGVLKRIFITICMKKTVRWLQSLPFQSKGSSKKGPEQSEVEGGEQNEGSYDEEERKEMKAAGQTPAWWRYCTNKTRESIKKRLFRHSFLPTLSDSSISPIPSIPTSYFFYYTFHGVDETRSLLKRVLCDLYRFLQSIVPLGPIDPLYPSLLSSFLLCSPLLTHLLPSQPPSSRSSPLSKLPPRPYKGAVPLSLMHELKTLRHNNNYTEESFSESVLRSHLPGLGETLSPLLALLSLPAPSARPPASASASASGSKGGLLSDAACSPALGALSQTLQQRQGVEREAEESQEGEEREEGEYVRRVVERAGGGYYLLLLSLLEAKEWEENEREKEREREEERGRGGEWREGWGGGLRGEREEKQEKEREERRLSGYMEYVSIHRYLFSLPSLSSPSPPSLLSSTPLPSSTLPNPSSSPLSTLPEPILVPLSFLDRVRRLERDFVERVLLHLRVCYGREIGRMVKGSLSQRYFTLLLCMYTFGQVHHAHLLSLVLSSSPTLPLAKFLDSQKPSILALWPIKNLDEQLDMVDARVQSQYQAARIFHVNTLKKRMWGRWKAQ